MFYVLCSVRTKKAFTFEVAKGIRHALFQPLGFMKPSPNQEEEEEEEGTFATSQRRRRQE